MPRITFPADRQWKLDGRPSTAEESPTARYDRLAGELAGWARWVRTVTDQQPHATDTAETP